MLRSLTRRICLALLLVAVSGGAQSRAELIDQLANHKDFRVRTQAALELGKNEGTSVRRALEGALDDPAESVRAAAASALKTLGEVDALDVLKEHRLDRSDAVRKQIASAIRTLEAKARPSKARVALKIGSMKNGTKVKSTSVAQALEAASRVKFREIPGIMVLEESESVERTKERRIPVVMLTGRIERLKASRDGESVVYSAKVEYMLHRMPQQSIAATFSGSASARASLDEAHDSGRAAELRRAVLDAAIDSAVRRAPEALLAAVD
jgi:hypothetical protein